MMSEAAKSGAVAARLTTIFEYEAAAAGVGTCSTSSCM